MIHDSILYRLDIMYYYLLHNLKTLKLCSIIYDILPFIIGVFVVDVSEYTSITYFIPLSCSGGLDVTLCIT